MGKIFYKFDPASAAVGSDTVTGVDTSKSAIFSNANVGDFVSKESPGPRKNFFSGLLQYNTSGGIYPLLFASTSPAKFIAGWHVVSATVTNDQWTVVVSDGHSIQTGDTIWFDFGSTSRSGNFMQGGMQITFSEYFRHIDNGRHDNVTVNGNTLTFTGNYDYGGTFAAGYNVGSAQIDSIQNPCFYAKVNYQNIGVQYLTPGKAGDFEANLAALYGIKKPNDTTSGSLNGWIYFTGGDSTVTGEKFYYTWLFLQPTSGSGEGATIAGSAANFAFQDDVIETVEFGGALVGNEDKGDSSEDESFISTSLISHDFITNKIITNNQIGGVSTGVSPTPLILTVGRITNPFGAGDIYSGYTRTSNGGWLTTNTGSVNQTSFVFPDGNTRLAPNITGSDSSYGIYIFMDALTVNLPDNVFSSVTANSVTLTESSGGRNIAGSAVFYSWNTPNLNFLGSVSTPTIGTEVEITWA